MHQVARRDLTRGATRCKDLLGSRIAAIDVAQFKEFDRHKWNILHTPHPIGIDTHQLNILAVGLTPLHLLTKQR